MSCIVYIIEIVSLLVKTFSIESVTIKIYLTFICVRISHIGVAAAVSINIIKLIRVRKFKMLAEQLLYNVTR